MSTIYKDKNITKMYYGSTPVYSFSVEDGGGTGSGLDFSLIGYDDKLSKEINDELNQPLVYSKQLYDEWDSSRNSAYSLYYGNSNLIYAPNIDTSNVNTFDSMFYNCTNLKVVPQYNTSKLISCNRMFYGCSTLTSIPMFDFSNATSMSEVFRNCSSITTIPELKTTNVTNFNYLFYGATNLETLPEIDTTNASSMTYFFGPSYMSSLTKLTKIGGFKNLKISITTDFLSRTPNLTTESLMNVINKLYDLTGNNLSGQTLNFGSTNLNKLTAEQIAVATAKGWTLT
jgi:hypothetical protein